MPPTDPSLNPAVVLALVFAGVLVLSLMVRFWLGPVMLATSVVTLVLSAEEFCARRLSTLPLT